MRSLLGLFIQYIVVGITDKRSIISMEEHLIWNLYDRLLVFNVHRKFINKHLFSFLDHVCFSNQTIFALSIYSFIVTCSP